MYRDDPVSCFLREVLMRLFHQRGVLAEGLQAEVGELCCLTVDWIVRVEIRLEQLQGVL